MQLIAKKDFVCSNVVRREGEKFEATPEQANPAIRWGFAEIVTASIEPVSEASQVESPAPRRSYSRRDMRAQD